MSEVERRDRGEDQGFESAALARFDDGRVALVGRGSQSLRWQCLGGGGWSERLQVDDSGWSCRGRRPAICRDGESVLVATRERDGIAVRELRLWGTDPAGAPELGPRRTSADEDTAAEPAGVGIRNLAGHRLLFGDIHQHTAASDGTGTAEETLLRARHRYGDDLVAISEHESFLGKETPPGEWHESRRVANEANEPGSFVTLHAFEWTGGMHPGPGHKVVYLPAEGGPVLSRDDDETSDARGLIAACRRRGALAFPHHVGWTGADHRHHDPEVQTCWEIVSCHGAYERPGLGPIGTRGDDKEGQFVAEALDRGLRFGLVGGSDGHGLNWHHGICRKADSHRTGLTGVFPDGVTRVAVLDALRRRRCYATSGAKIGLWFEVEERPMGEEVIAGGPVPFRVVISATDELDSVALVTNGGEELPLDVSGIIADLSGSLPPPVGPWSYYFVRVLQRDGEMAWSSPIWLDSPDPA